MRRVALISSLFLLFSSVLMAGAADQQTTNTESVEIKTKRDSASYAVGINVANSLKEDGLTDLDPLIIARAIEDIFKGKQLMVSENEANKALNEIFAEAQNALKMAKMKKGLDFLEENKKIPGVNVTPSGLQYEVITMGNGAKPGPTSRVNVHYHGTLIDGRVFDSSVQRGQPITFGLNQVIRGWTEGLQLMPVGSKFKFYIPYNLAYGEKGPPGSIIGEFETLIFEVELLGIE